MKLRSLWWASLVLALSSSAAAGNVNPTRISLPQGPGSVEGLGRNFSPSLSSGTASYGVDIAVPPGAAGFQPKISLDYDSGAGVSALGMGWRLSGLPQVRRRTENGLPRFTDQDAFEVVGFGPVSDLILVDDGVFRPEYESGSFVRVERQNEHEWVARDKSGVTYHFGGEGCEEAEGTHVATYLLCRSRDLHGHVIDYTWDPSEGHALLDRVVYNDFGADVRNELRFEYEQAARVFIRYDSGIEQRYSRRLARVEVSHGGALVRSYDVEYGGVAQQPWRIVLTGSDGVTSLPTLTLGYTEGDLDPADVVTMLAAPGRSPADSDVELTDLDGDGLPDLLVSDAGGFRSYLNHDGKSWQRGMDWGAAKSPSARLGALGVQLADVDGDGANDFVIKSGTSDFRYLPAASATSFGPARAITPVPSFSFEDPNLRLADMDGDRRVDAVLTLPDDLVIAYNVHGATWLEPRSVGRVDARQSLLFSDGATQLCDVNGDRVMDLCRLRSASLVYWLGRGRGVFTTAEAASNVPEWDPNQTWQLQDLNGDGWPDLVSIGVSSLSVALADAQGSFADVVTVDGTPSGGPSTTIRFADMNGSGTADVVWIDVSAGSARSWRYLELFPRGRAGLLETIDNGLGKEVSISYAPAALDAAIARDAGTPWQTRANVGMSVVRSITTSMGPTDPPMVQEIHYRDGTFSAVERTFAGFAGATDIRPGDEHTPTLVTTTTYDVGLEDRTLRGLPLAVENRSDSGWIFDRLVHTYVTRTLDVGLDGRPIRFSFERRQDREYVEGDAQRARATRTEFDVDEYGNVTLEKRWGEVADGDVLAGNDEALITRTFANDAESWVLGRLVTEETADAAGERVSLEQNFYDGEPFVGLPLGEVEIGNVTRREAWVGPELDAYELVSSTAYDTDGNVIETRDARGGGRKFEWDAENRTTLVAERVATGGEVLEIKARFDAAYGQVVAVEAYNGSKTIAQYDALGRLAKLVKPGDSLDLPTLQIRYELAAPLSRVVTASRVHSGSAGVDYSVGYVDGMGRKRGTLFALGAGRFALRGAVLFDARGNSFLAMRARRVETDSLSLPELTQQGPGDTSSFDALGRVTEVSSAQGIVTRTGYGPLQVSRWDGAQSDESSPYEHTPLVTEHDGLARVVSKGRTVRGEAVTTRFAYDPAGRLKARRDADGNVSGYLYDGRGRCVAVDDPDAGVHAFVYDATGNRVEHHYPGGGVRLDTFDLAGRVVSEDWDGDGNPEVERRYDEGDATNRGLPVSVTDPSGGVELEYDQRQLLTRTTLRIGEDSYTSETSYDAQNRPQRHVYPDGSSVAIRYNERGLVAGYGDDIVSFAYDANGVEVERTYAGGVVQQHGYDADLRRIDEKVEGADGVVIQYLKWTLDGANNVTSVEDARADRSGERDRSESYTYDSLYRLVRGSGTWGVTDYRYSPSGNLLRRDSTESTQDLGALEYGAADAGPHGVSRVGDREVRRDVRGRIIDDGDRSYTWNEADQLVAVERRDGGSELNQFDADGVRRARIETSAARHVSATHFIDDWSEVRDGNLVRYVAHGGQRIVRLSEDNIGEVASDAMASGDDRASQAKRGWLGPSSWQLFEPQRFLLPAVLVLVLLLAIQRRARAAFFRGVAGVLAVGALTACVGCSDSASPASASRVRAGDVRTLTDGDQLLFSDALGSLTETTTATGRAVASSAQYPFGIARYNDSSETRQYADTPRDVSVALDQMGARSYAPDLASFVSPDPILLEPAQLVASLAIDAYAYANGNPIKNADRTGWLVEPAIATAPAIVAGAAQVAAIASAFTVALAVVAIVTVVATVVVVAHHYLKKADAEKASPPRAITPAAPTEESSDAPAPQPAADGAQKPPCSDSANPRRTGDALKAARSEFENKAKPARWMHEAATNAERYSPEQYTAMINGDAPMGTDGYPMELHHKTPLAQCGSNDFDNLQAMTRTDHRLGPNYKLNHPTL